MRNKFLLFICTALLGCSLLSCNNNNKELIPEGAEDNYITSVVLTLGGETYTGRIEGQEIRISVPYTVSLQGAQAQFTYSELATIYPDPKTIANWDEERTFRVTSYLKEPRDYIYRVVHEDISAQGDVSILSQTDIDQLVAKGINVIGGDLILGSDDLAAQPLESLQGLEIVKEVGGSLVIRGSYAPSGLTGLEGLTSVGGLVVGTAQEASEAFDGEGYLGLPALQTISGNLELHTDNVLWVDLPALREITGNVTISSAKLYAVDMSALTAIGGALTVDGKGNNNDLSILILPALERVGGDIDIHSVPGLEGISFAKLTEAGAIMVSALPLDFETVELPELTTVNGNIIFASGMKFDPNAGGASYNTGVREMNMDNLRSVAGTIYLSHLDELTRMPDLSRLTLLGGLNFEHLARMSQTTLDISQAEITDTVRLYNIPIRTLKGPEASDCCLILYETYPEIEGFRTLGEFRYEGGTANPSQIELPVVSVRRNFLFDLPQTTELSCPALEEVGGYFALPYSTGLALKEASFPELKSVGGQFVISATNIESMDFTALEEVGKTGQIYAGSYKEEIFWVNFPQLAEVNFPSLKHVYDESGLCIETGSSMMDAKCTAIRMPKLETVEGGLKISGDIGYRLDFFYNTLMSTLDLSSLESAKSVFIECYPSLTDFSSLKGVLSNLSDETWTVEECGANPTYAQMKAEYLQ